MPTLKEILEAKKNEKKTETKPSTNSALATALQNVKTSPELPKNIIPDTVKLKKSEPAPTKETLENLEMPEDKSNRKPGRKFNFGTKKRQQAVIDQASEKVSKSGNAALASAASKFKTNGAQKPTENKIIGDTVTGVLVDDIGDKSELTHTSMPDEYIQAELDEIKQSLELLQESIDDVKLVSQVLENTLLKIRQNPELAEILHEEDFGIMVQGLRKSYANHAARVTAKDQKKRQNAKRAEGFMNAFKSGGFKS